MTLDLKTILDKLNPEDFNTNNDLYRYLEQYNFGVFNTLRGWYQKNSEFKQLIDEWRNSTDIVFEEYIPDDNVDLEKLIESRDALYQKESKKHSIETQRAMFKVDTDFSVSVIVSDPHFDDAGSNIKLFFDTIKYFNQFDETMFISLGDWANFWIQNWSSKMAVTSNLTPANGIELTIEALKLMGNKHKISCLGNHDEWAINAIGYDIFEQFCKQYSPNILYSKHSVIAKFFNNTTQSEWIKFNHYFKGGKSMWNPHQSNIRHLMLNESTDVNFAVSGHYHWPQASYGEFPFENRIIKSLLLGSIKDFDEYAKSLGMSANAVTNPFGFIFLYDGHQEVITNIEIAKMRFKQLKG